MVEPDDCKELLGRSRSAHWVLRTSDLKASLRFLCTVLGMKVLRHEEYEKPCAITCNGDFAKPWSKTMIGYGREDENYCLELTYNYGVPEYDVGSGLAHIAVGVDRATEALATAADLGYSVDGSMVTGPDGYRCLVMEQPSGRTERFQHVALRVADLARSAEFYTGVLGMSDFPHVQAPAGEDCPSRGVGYTDDEVPLLLMQTRDFSPPSGAWEGRSALALPGRAMRAVYTAIEDEAPERVLHEIREFNEMPALRRLRGLPPMTCRPPPEEQLRRLREDPKSAPEEGTMAVAVIKDVDGYEICLVSREAFDLAVANAFRPDVEIDWSWRGDAMAGNRRPTPPNMLSCV